MPPRGEMPRPTPHDIETIVGWINAGAPDFGPVERAGFVSNEQVYKGLRADLGRVRKNDAKFMRYLTVMHLRMSGLSDDEIETYRLALSKLLNSLSWNRRLVALTPIDKYKTVFRIDLRDLKWTAAIWDSIAASYPYIQIIDSREAIGCRTITECDVPLVRGDWFIAAASRPPLYHELLQLPETDAALERLLHVDVAKNIRERKAVRAGFARSGVSQNNRLIERHDSIFGAYWRTYDFSANTGNKNLFEHPLGPGEADGFQHDGGEIIFTLPNGMLGFMLVDAFGRRIDKGPTQIVSDPRQPDRAVVNGASCMACHSAGVVRKTDEIRPHVQRNPDAFDDIETILALYPDSATIEKQLEADARNYQQTLASDEIGITRLSSPSEPINVVAERFRDDVDARTAAAELGIAATTLPKVLGKLSSQSLVRAVGPLKAGGIIKRDSFENAFHDLVAELKLGSTVLLAQRQPRPARKVDQNDRVSPEQRNAATDELQAGIVALNRRDWQLAQAKLQEALRLAPDDVFRIKVYEQLVPVYERLPTIEKLVEAYQFIINTVPDEASQRQAIDAFFRSVVAHVKGDQFWNRNVPPIALWNGVKVPVSTSTVITSSFESHLAKNPDHEPTLRVLATVYRYITADNERRRAILEKLESVVAGRRGQLEPLLIADLAAVYVATGDPAKGATRYEQLAKDQPNDDSTGQTLIEAAMAWQGAGDNEKALIALGRAERLVSARAAAKKPFATYQLEQVGDIYMELDAKDKAVKPYRLALTATDSSAKTEQLQNKLRLAAGRATGDHPADDSLDTLLDPKRKFRQQAERDQKLSMVGDSVQPGNLISATRNWIQAGDMKKALDAAKQAEKALSRPGDDPQRADYHADLAELCRQLNQPQLALRHWIEALKQSTEERDIVRYQEKLSTMIVEHAVDTGASADELKTLLDKNYKYRAQAKHFEQKEALTPEEATLNLIESAAQWVNAGDEEQARRSATKAAEKLKRLPPTSLGGAASRLSAQLGAVYVSIGEYETAIKHYVQAIRLSNSERDAKRYAEQLAVLCKQANLPMPDLDVESAKKLDPLNKYRVEAEEAEQRAKESRFGRTRYLIDAAENWLEAEDIARARAAAQKAATEAKRSRGGTASATDYEKLAKLFTRLDDPRSARGFYKLAIENTTSTRRKEDLERALQDLNDLADPMR